MTFLEPAARALLVVHAIVGAALVASATHHLVWCRRYLGGEFPRVPGERLLATVTACLFVASFALGYLLYPTYKARVRYEYFDAPAAVTQEESLRQTSATTRHDPPPARGPGQLFWVGRLFDVKEHQVALGAFAALGLWVLSRRAHPKDDPSLAIYYVLLSAFVAATAWTGAIVGLVTASFRAVGGAS